VTSSTPTPSTGPRTSEDEPSGARHRDAAVPTTDDATVTTPESTGPDLAASAAEAERALAEAAKAAEQAVAEAHDDGQDAVKKGYDDARRAAEQAYEQSSARADRG
jgi:flagellar biosynthesis/type III secretory pathway protein FliH